MKNIKNEMLKQIMELSTSEIWSGRFETTPYIKREDVIKIIENLIPDESKYTEYPMSFQERLPKSVNDEI